MKKILILSTSPLRDDGITITILNYTENIKKYQIDYAFSKIVNEEIKEELIKNGHKVFDLSKNNSIRKNKNVIKYCQNLNKIMEDEKYDLIHVNGSSRMMTIELLIAKKNKCNIRICHSHNTKTDHPIINIIMTPIFKRSYTYAIACGKEAGEFLYGKNAKFEILPNANKSEKFLFSNNEREKTRKKLNLEKNDILIGHVGGFNKQKNQIYLIEILKNLLTKNKRYYLLLIGTGYNREEIIKKIKNEKIENNVILIKNIRNDEINKYYSAMDIGVLPSLYEGLPNVLIEWQISGLPCLASTNVTKEANITGDIKYISLKKCNEWITEIQNINIINRENKSIENWKKIKKAGYDIDIQKKKLEKLYDKLLK